MTFHGRAAPINEPLGPFGSTQYKGLFRAKLADEGPPEISVVVDTNTVMPGGDVTFSTDFANGLTSQYVAVDGGDVLFRGVGTVGDEKTRIGLYLYDSVKGVVVEVLEIGDTLSGKAVDDILMSRQAISQREIVIWVGFADGGDAIYRAKLD